MVEITVEEFNRLHKKNLKEGMNYIEGITKINTIKHFDRETMIDIFDRGEGNDQDDIGLYMYVALMTDPLLMVELIMREWGSGTYPFDVIEEYNRFYRNLATKMGDFSTIFFLNINHPESTGIRIELTSYDFNFDYFKAVRSIGGIPVYFSNDVCTDENSQHHCVRPVLTISMKNVSKNKTTEYNFFVKNNYLKPEECLGFLASSTTIHNDHLIMCIAEHFQQFDICPDGHECLISPDGKVVHKKTLDGRNTSDQIKKIFLAKMSQKNNEKVSDRSPPLYTKIPEKGIRVCDEPDFKLLHDHEIKLSEAFMGATTCNTKQIAMLKASKDNFIEYIVTHLQEISPMLLSSYINGRTRPSILSVLLNHEVVVAECIKRCRSNDGRDIEHFCIFVDINNKLHVDKPIGVKYIKKPLHTALAYCIVRAAVMNDSFIGPILTVAELLHRMNFVQENEEYLFRSSLNLRKAIDKCKLVLQWLNQSTNTY